MVKTLTIKDDVYIKLKSQKKEDESFSDLFERLVDTRNNSNIDILKKIRGSMKFNKNEKEIIFKDIWLKRREHRF